MNAQTFITRYKWAKTKGDKHFEIMQRSPYNSGIYTYSKIKSNEYYDQVTEHIWSAYKTLSRVEYDRFCESIQVA
jgi:hypothetical protein